MKKVMLGCAMLFAVTCAKANDVSVDNAVVSEVFSAMVETEGSINSANVEVAVMPECFGLSCTTVCFEDQNFDEFDIENVFEVLEDVYCGED